VFGLMTGALTKAPLVQWFKSEAHRQIEVRILKSPLTGLAMILVGEYVMSLSSDALCRHLDIIMCRSSVYS